MIGVPPLLGQAVRPQVAAVQQRRGGVAELGEHSPELVFGRGLVGVPAQARRLQSQGSGDEPGQPG